MPSPQNRDMCVNSRQLFQKTRKPPFEVAPTILATFSSCDHEIWPITWTFESDLDSVNVSQRAMYLGQGHLSQKLLSALTDTQTHTHTHTHIWLIAVPGPLMWVAIYATDLAKISKNVQTYFYQ